MFQRGAAGAAGRGAALPVAGDRDRDRGPGLREPRHQHAPPDTADPADTADTADTADRHHAAAGHGHNHHDAEVHTA